MRLSIFRFGALRRRMDTPCITCMAYPFFGVNTVRWKSSALSTSHCSLLFINRIRILIQHCWSVVFSLILNYFCSEVTLSSKQESLWTPKSHVSILRDTERTDCVYRELHEYQFYWYIEYEIIIRSDNTMVWMFETVCTRLGSSFTRHILYLWFWANDCFFTIGFLNGFCNRQWCDAVCSLYCREFSIAHKFITRFVINVRLLNNGRVPFGDSGKRRKNGSLVGKQGKQAAATVTPRSLAVKCVPATNTRRWNFLQYSSPVMTANRIS